MDAGIRGWQESNRLLNNRVRASAECGHPTIDSGNPRMQESVDGKKSNRSLTEFGYPQDAGIRGWQESSTDNIIWVAADVGYPTTVSGNQRMQESADDKNLNR